MYINTGLIESLTYTELQERLEEVNDALGQIAFIRKYAYAEPYSSQEEQEERLKFLDSGEAELDRLHAVYSAEKAQRDSDAEEGGYCPICTTNYTTTVTPGHHGQLEYEYNCQCP